jgi:ATP-binding cassette subfamily C (CFTR/MRP) protein 1
VLLDDPIAAVDAHVGKALFHGAIMKLRAQGKAVVLITHALHLLHACDYIYTLAHGAVVEAGTYTELIRADGEFARLDREFGGAQEAKEDKEDEEEAVSGDKQLHVAVDEEKSKAKEREGAGTGKLEGRLIISEKRTTGSVSTSVYWEYLKVGVLLCLWEGTS